MKNLSTNIQQQSHALSYASFVQIQEKTSHHIPSSYPKVPFPMTAPRDVQDFERLSCGSYAPTLILQVLQGVLCPTGAWDCLKIALTLTVHNDILISCPLSPLKI